MKEAFVKSLHTLLFSWGTETPPEAVWAANDFLQYYEEEMGIEIGARFDEEDWEHNQELMDSLITF